jgi:hypothetical protein
MLLNPFQVVVSLTIPQWQDLKTNLEIRKAAINHDSVTASR